MQLRNAGAAPLARVLAGCALMLYAAGALIVLLLVGSLGWLVGLNTLWLLLPAATAVIGIGTILGYRWSIPAAFIVLVPMLFVAVLTFASAQQTPDFIAAIVLLGVPIGVGLSLASVVWQRARGRSG